MHMNEFAKKVDKKESNLKTNIVGLPISTRFNLRILLCFDVILLYKVVLSEA